MPSPSTDDRFLQPREAAELLDVNTVTLARWAREGLLTPVGRTPGGHRRYSRTEVLDLCKTRSADQEMAEDAARLYEQGWAIRQVASKFDLSYGQMRRLLRKHTTLRNGGT